MSARSKGVLVLTSTFPARPGDGTPGFVLSLSQELAKTLPVTVVAPRVRGAARRDRFDGVDVIRFRYFPKRWEGLADSAIMPALRAQPWRLVEVPTFLLAYLFTALRTTIRQRPALINAHWVIPAGVVALVVRVLTRTPYVLTAHGADAFVLSSGLPALVKRLVLTRASAVLPVSNDIAEALRALGANCHEPIPMGVDVAAIRAATAPRAPEPGRLLFIGRLAGKKGVSVLLDAMTLAPATRLVIVGDGPDRRALEAQTERLGLEGRVAFRGQQPRAEVEAELRRAAVLVVPSVVDSDGDKDGTPVVLPEALAAGLPVVASDLAGLGEHLTDGVDGLLVPPDDVAALAAALRRATDDPRSLVSVAEAGRRLAEERFDLAVIASQYLSVFSMTR